MVMKKVALGFLSLFFYICTVGFGFPKLDKIPGLGNFPMPQQSGAPGNACPVDNPLKGVEMDLTVVDEIITLLKLNDLMIYRLQISQDATWPDVLGKGVKTLTQEEKDYVMNRLKYDFSYMDLYGEESFAITDLFSFSRAGQKIVSMAAVELGKEVVYAKMTIGDQIYARANVPPATVRKGCAFFDQPVEDVLFDSMTDGDLDRFMQEKVEPGCMVQAVATTGNIYTSFKEAFDFLLPAELLAKSNEIEVEIEGLEDGKRQLATEKATLEAQENKDGACQERIMVLKKEIASAESAIDEQEILKEKQLEEAKGSIADEAGDPEKVAIARQLHKITNKINANLGQAMPVTTAITAKLVFDVQDLASAAANPMAVAQAMADEMVRKGRYPTRAAALAATQERVAKLLKRTVKFVPCVVETTASVVSQKRKLSFYDQYLAVLLNAADKEQVATSSPELSQ